MYSCPYVCYTTNKRNKIYIDLKGGRYAWERPIDFTKTCHLTIDDVNVCMCSFKVLYLIKNTYH